MSAVEYVVPNRAVDAPDELPVGRLHDRPVVAPPADGLDGGSAVEDARRRLPRLVRVGPEPREDPEPAPRRPERQDRRHREPGGRPLERRYQVDEMGRKPQVVVTEIGDVLSPGELEAPVVRRGLAAAVPREVLPAHTRVGEPSNGRLGVVGARVADDDHLERGVGLSQRRRYGVPEDAAPVVRRDHDADERRPVEPRVHVRVAEERPRRPRVGRRPPQPRHIRYGIALLSIGTRYLSGSVCSYGRDGRFTNIASTWPTFLTAWYTPAGIRRRARSRSPK